MPRGTDKLVLRAPAKINLCLEVLGRRRNGYHDIRSVVTPISLADVLTLRKARRSISTRVWCGSLPGGDQLNGLGSGKNLTTRAAEALRKATGYRGGAAIEIEKRIPVGGGLGGGSADAAAALRGLNELWDLGLSRAELATVGATVGCDIPALLHGGMVLMEGLGERVTPFPAGHANGAYWVVLVNPGFHVATKDIYRRHRSTLTSGRTAFTRFSSALKQGAVELLAARLFNDLQDTVFHKYPLIEMVAEALKKAGALGVLVSGSGASVFGLARGREHARRCERRVRKILGYPVWSKVARTLPDGVTVAHGPLEARV